MTDNRKRIRFFFCNPFHEKTKTVRKWKFPRLGLWKMSHPTGQASGILLCFSARCRKQRKSSPGENKGFALHRRCKLKKINDSGGLGWKFNCCFAIAENINFLANMNGAWNQTGGIGIDLQCFLNKHNWNLLLVFGQSFSFVCSLCFL